MKGLTPAPDWLTSLPIAHRGYHDAAAGVVENSISAFQTAVDANFAIECDIQITATGEPAVFHDEELARLTGIDGLVRKTSPAVLADMKLLGTREGIYLLKDHLDIVADKVPVIVELKGIEGDDDGMVEGVAETFSKYDGRVAIMSFDHWLCVKFADLMPDTPRGLVAKGGADASPTHEQAMHEFDLQFVTYRIDDLPHPFVAAARRAGLPTISWTVRTDKQRAISARFVDQMTFEGFDPRTGKNSG